MGNRRCTDLEIGQKILSYDLLEGEEKQVMDAHLEVCAACRDLLQQTYGKEGALDELNWRVWRLTKRQRVEPGWWIAERLRDLWLPFVLLAVVVGLGGLVLLNRSGERSTVRILRFAVSRNGMLDSTATPHIARGASSLILRTDRDARAYVYEVRQDSLRRLLPPQDGEPPEVGSAEARELALPPLAGDDSRVVLMLVPRDAPGTVDEWDAAVFAYLGRGKRPQDVSGVGWPGRVRPALRYYP